MELECRSVGNVTLAKPLDRRVDARSADDLKEGLNRLIDAGHRFVALDLSSVEFVDSSGLGAMIFAFKALENRGELAIVKPHPVVRSLFRMTGTDSLFRIFSDENEALAALGG
jgi:anti-sigma B factor antagonist